MKSTYYTLVLVVAIILLAMFFLGNAHAQEVDTGEITVTSSTIANILPVSTNSDYLTSLPAEGEAWRADRIAVLVDASQVGQEPMFQPDSLLIDSLNAVFAEVQAMLTEQAEEIANQDSIIAVRDAEITEKDALIASQEDEIAELRVAVDPLEQQIVEQDALIAEYEARIAEYEEGLAIARESLGQFQRWLREFDASQ